MSATTYIGKTFNQFSKTSFASKTMNFVLFVIADDESRNIDDEASYKLKLYNKFMFFESMYFYIKYLLISSLILFNMKIGSSDNIQFETNFLRVNISSSGILDIIGSPCCQDKQKSLLICLCIIQYMIVVQRSVPKLINLLHNCDLFRFIELTQSNRQLEYNDHITKNLSRLINRMSEFESKFVYKQCKCLFEQMKYWQYENKCKYSSLKQSKQYIKYFTRNDSATNNLNINHEYIFFSLFIIFAKISSSIFFYILVFGSGYSNRSSSRKTGDNICLLSDLETVFFVLFNPLNLVSVSIFALSSLKNFWLFLGQIKIDMHENNDLMIKTCQVYREKQQQQQQDSYSQQIIIDEFQLEINKFQQMLSAMYLRLSLFEHQVEPMAKLVDKISTMILTFYACLATTLLLLTKSSLFPAQGLSDAIIYIILLNPLFVCTAMYNRKYEKFLYKSLHAIISEITYVDTIIVSYQIQYNHDIASSNQATSNKQVPEHNKIMLYKDFTTNKLTSINPFILMHWRRKLENLDFFRHKYSIKVRGIYLSYSILVTVSFFL